MIVVLGFGTEGMWDGGMSSGGLLCSDGSEKVTGRRHRRLSAEPLHFRNYLATETAVRRRNAGARVRLDRQRPSYISLILSLTHNYQGQAEPKILFPAAVQPLQLSP